MAIIIKLNSEQVNRLDLSPVQTVIDSLSKNNDITAYEQQISFEIDYPRDPEDPREISEVPEIRLWFIRLDAQYPWLPLFLDWKSGELARYVAMLVPHQFHRTEGIQYNPEALEIFLMQKIFILDHWFTQNNLTSKSRLMAMAQMLGYDLDDTFFETYTQGC
ncbi:CRR6 family NdhI maturation factor [Planktothrix agardhii]|uniref:CRR6 family NdhI maturation factor n=1 Tax=Planktothrix agardhii TaxID=1160 RepID=UPI001D0B3C08|nr:CRR6 family NdhI maturation factor [Planktothrix agardhii]MCB8764860.1 CRR6 family NdhI maturation factor [Planktothrix agardhii 1809]MCB8782917.1 CRR6 family NdhI maturation factor [Planktothrix agardhii 1808]MCF3566057.1 CRR6 family NdhI maturation factor [Planktothrix agardhii 1807]CAD5969385.1 Protein CHLORORESPIRATORY REDUCTION 6, chloroplastic [Planktothrix agardhii]